MSIVARRDPYDFMDGLARSRSAQLLREELGRRWSDSTDSLSAIVRYALLPPGKLIRPIMTLHCAEAVGGCPTEVLPAALGTEYLHVATLVHDDIIDADDVRRGRPSVPVAFGKPDALVTGDHLIFAAFSAIVECRASGALEDRVVAAVDALATAGTDLCRGQIMEARLVGVPETDIDSYLEMIRLKTGAMFRAVCQIGALLGGADPDRARLLAEYGENLGMAFQIRDDLLSYTADAETTGKPATSDLANGRPTLPVLLAYAASPPADRLALAGALRSRATDPAALVKVRHIVGERGAVAASRNHAAEYCARAVARLSTLQPSPSLQVLTGVVDWAMATEGHDE